MPLSDQQIDQFITNRHLPGKFRNLVDLHYLPLAGWIVARRTTGNTLLVGLNGAQGTGKSTLAAFLQLVLETDHGWRVAVLSIDDFYLTRQERSKLAERIHPLLATRGVPGTHDMEMLGDCVRQLKALGASEKLLLPRFDKARDERAARDRWPVIAGPVDLVILEGWCVGSRPQTDAELIQPVNLLEREQDIGGKWRQYVNQQLGNQYAKLFRQLDALIVLQAPRFGCVYRWRLEQEEKLAAQATAAAPAVMNERQLERFIQFYERLTRANLRTLAKTANVVLELDDQHDCTRSFEVATGQSLAQLTFDAANEGPV